MIAEKNNSSEEKFSDIIAATADRSESLTGNGESRRDTHKALRREQVARFRFRDVRFLDDTTSVAREGQKDGKKRLR